jgi:hypothetical protein
MLSSQKAKAKSQPPPKTTMTNLQVILYLMMKVSMLSLYKARLSVSIQNHTGHPSQ